MRNRWLTRYWLRRVAHTPELKAIIDTYIFGRFPSDRADELILELIDKAKAEARCQNGSEKI